MKNFFGGIWQFLKNFSEGLIFRLKPRWQLRWIITFVLWLLLVVYLGFGVYFGWEIYAKKNETGTVKFSAKIYPFPAAFVGGNIIWAKDYYQQFSYIRQFSEKTKQTSPDAKLLRSQIMDQLVENRLLAWEASKNGLRVTSRDIEDAFQKIVSESGGAANVKKVLRELYGMSEKEFKEWKS